MDLGKIGNLIKGTAGQAKRFGEKNLLKVGTHITPLHTINNGINSVKGSVLNFQKTRAENQFKKLAPQLGLQVVNVQPAEVSSEASTKTFEQKIEENNKQKEAVKELITTTTAERKTKISSIEKSYYFKEGNKDSTGSKVRTFQLDNTDKLSVFKEHVENNATLNHAQFETGALKKLLGVVGDDHKHKIVTALSNKQKFTTNFTKYSNKIKDLEADNSLEGTRKLAKARLSVLSKLGVSQSDFDLIAAAVSGNTDGVGVGVGGQEARGPANGSALLTDRSVAATITQRSAPNLVPGGNPVVEGLPPVAQPAPEGEPGPSTADGSGASTDRSGSAGDRSQLRATLGQRTMSESDLSRSTVATTQPPVAAQTVPGSEAGNGSTASNGSTAGEPPASAASVVPAPVATTQPPVAAPAPESEAGNGSAAAPAPSTDGQVPGGQWNRFQQGMGAVGGFIAGVRRNRQEGQQQPDEQQVQNTEVSGGNTAAVAEVSVPGSAAAQVEVTPDPFQSFLEGLSAVVAGTLEPFQKLFSILNQAIGTANSTSDADMQKLSTEDLNQLKQGTKQFLSKLEEEENRRSQTNSQPK